MQSTVQNNNNNKKLSEFFLSQFYNNKTLAYFPEIKSRSFYHILNNYKYKYFIKLYVYIPE